MLWPLASSFSWPAEAEATWCGVLPAVLDTAFSTIAVLGPIGMLGKHQFGQGKTDQASVPIQSPRDALSTGGLDVVCSEPLPD